MYEEDIKALQEWINDDDRYFDTSYNGEEYCICEHDIEDFCDFLRERSPDLIGAYPVWSIQAAYGLSVKIYTMQSIYSQQKLKFSQGFSQGKERMNEVNY